MKVNGIVYREFQNKLRFIQQTRFDDQDKERLTMGLLELYYESMMQESVQ